MKRLYIFVALMAVISLACNMPGINLSGEKPSGVVSSLLVTADPNATSTPTPFAPGSSTTTQVSGNTSTASPSASPTATVRPTLAVSEDHVKILLLGSDWRPESGYRTDTIMLVSINKKTGATSVVSFPRDLFVTLPGYRQERINVAQPLGGFDLTQKTFEYNFGFTPDYFVMTNFQGFISIIDSLGGVDVYVPWVLADSCNLPSKDEEGNCSIGPGTVHMDGATALWYVRSRKSTSDFDRTRRSQDVMKAAFVKLMNLNAIARLPDLYSAFKSSVVTNLPLDVVISLGRFAPDLLSNSDKIHQYAIGPNDVWAWVTPEGAQVLLPNPDKIQPLLEEALNVK